MVRVIRDRQESDMGQIVRGHAQLSHSIEVVPAAQAGSLKLRQFALTISPFACFTHFVRITSVDR